MNQTQITTLDIVNSIGLRGCYKHFKFKEPELYAKIEQAYGDRFVECLYNFIYGDKQRRNCLECPNPVTFQSFHKGYAFFCGGKCVAINRAHKQKKKKTNQERFGVDKPAQNKEVDTKRRKTLKRKYGTDSLAKIRWAKKNKGNNGDTSEKKQ